MLLGFGFLVLNCDDNLFCLADVGKRDQILLNVVVSCVVDLYGIFWSYCCLPYCPMNFFLNAASCLLFL